MSDKADWAELRPILQDMADRIARIEQFLAASGLQAPSSGSSAGAAEAAQAAGSGGVFDSVPASFGAAPAFNTPEQIAAPFSGPQPGVVPDDILLLARSGKQIQAIKELRNRTGLSLKQAKDIIDQAVR